jgi:hypothetical protein
MDDLLVVLSIIPVGVGELMFIRLGIKFGKLIRVALKGEPGSGVCEWGT